MNIKLSLLIISLLTASLFAGEPITPRQRLTEAEKVVEQSIRVQTEIYEYLNLLKGYIDSTYVLQGIDTLDGSGEATVYLREKYGDANYSVAPAVIALGNAYSISWWPLSDSSFAVKAEVADSAFSWLAIGVK